METRQKIRVTSQAVFVLISRRQINVDEVMFVSDAAQFKEMLVLTRVVTGTPVDFLISPVRKLIVKKSTSYFNSLKADIHLTTARGDHTIYCYANAKMEKSPPKVFHLS